jgi:uncharacterized protein involved in copper resistance
MNTKILRRRSGASRNPFWFGVSAFCITAATLTTPIHAQEFMHMPKQPTKPVEVQHLDFGNMTGTRPKPGGLAEGVQGMNMPSMQGMDMSSMQGSNAPADARSPDYSDGYRYTDMPGMAMSEVNLYGKDDPQRGIGSGVSDAALGVRLRYEIRPEFAGLCGCGVAPAFRPHRRC